MRPSYRQTVLGDGPLFYWRLADGTAVQSDTTGNARGATGHGTIVYGAPSLLVADQADKAVTLDGATGYLGGTVSMIGPQQFTLEASFQTTTTAGGKIAGFGDASSGASGSYDRHVYMTNAGALVFGARPTAGVVTCQSPSGVAYNDNHAHHVVATLGGGNQRLYVDGNLVASISNIAGAGAYAGYWRVGWDLIAAPWPSIPTSVFFAGTVDEVSVYGSAFSPAQVAVHYDAWRQAAPTTAPPSGDAMPTDGYLLPLFPPGWLDDAPVATAYVGAMDRALDGARTTMGALRDAHAVARAQGTDLNDLVALVGVLRGENETDGQLRARAPAIAHAGIAASTIPAIQSALNNAFAVPAIVSDVAGTPGAFLVTLLLQPARPALVVPFVNQIKAAGTTFTARIPVVSTQRGPRAGTFRAAKQRAGGAGSYLQLT